MKKVTIIIFLLLVTSCGKNSTPQSSGETGSGIQSNQPPTAAEGISPSTGDQRGSFILHPAPPCPQGQLCNPDYHSETEEDRKFSF